MANDAANDNVTCAADSIPSTFSTLRLTFPRRSAASRLFPPYLGAPVLLLIRPKRQGEEEWMHELTPAHAPVSMQSTPSRAPSSLSLSFSLPFAGV